MSGILVRTAKQLTISGDITTTTAPFTPGTLEAEWVLLNTVGVNVIPDSEGAFKVEVQNTSGTEPGTEFGNILVNGDTLATGGIWWVDSQIDYTTNPPTQCFTPEVSVSLGDDQACRYRITRKA